MTASDVFRAGADRGVHADRARLGFFTVAESVETPEMRDHCRSLGIDFVQGYAFSGPAPLDSILPLERIEDPDAV